MDTLDLKTPRSLPNEENISKWSNEIEDLLSEWCEIAHCYSWLHSYSERKYKKKYHNLQIPIIVLSTLTGTANLLVIVIFQNHSENLLLLLSAVSIYCVGYLELY